uniref:Uncharacterized protein n=1 Tax=Solanum tuberosum TaxID=4113 RepID=M1DMX3_SOLTU
MVQSLCDLPVHALIDEVTYVTDPFIGDGSNSDLDQAHRHVRRVANWLKSGVCLRMCSFACQKVQSATRRRDFSYFAILFLFCVESRARSWITLLPSFSNSLFGTQSKKAPPKGGRGKGKVPVAERPEHNSGSDGEPFDSQVSLSEPKDDQPLLTLRVEIRARFHQDLSRIPESTPPADTVRALAQTVVPTPPV